MNKEKEFNYKQDFLIRNYIHVSLKDLCRLSLEEQARYADLPVRVNILNTNWLHQYIDDIAIIDPNKSTIGDLAYIILNSKSEFICEKSRLIYINCLKVINDKSRCNIS